MLTYTEMPVRGVQSSLTVVASEWRTRYCQRSLRTRRSRRDL